VCAANGNADALAALTTTMSAKEIKGAMNSAAAIKTLAANFGSKRHDAAVNGAGRVLVELGGPTEKSIVLATKIEQIVHFVELTLSHVVDLTGGAVWKEPKLAEPPTEGNSRCAECGQEYRKGQSRNHKNKCRRKVDDVWADRDCASEKKPRIRLSGSVVRTPQGVDWTPSSQHSKIMAKNGIVVLSVTQNADGIDT
jgi:hypothetical protein